MNVQDVKREVERIANACCDDEGAHSMEDRLRSDVLGAIALGTAEPSPQALAAAALETDDIEFSRWCA